MLGLVLQVGLRLLQDHVVLPCAFNRAVLRRLDLPQMRKSYHLILADVGATHHFGLTAHSDQRHVLLELYVSRLLAARLGSGMMTASAGHYLIDVLLLLEVLVHVLLAHLVVTARRLYHNLARQISADGHARAVLALRLSLTLRALHGRVGRLLVDWGDTARLRRATTRVAMR